MTGSTNGLNNDTDGILTIMNLIDHILLLPYYLTLRIRHALYDSGKKKSYAYDIPVICVGNITVGGTGKTPHTEMLIRLLKEDFRIAVISRGYRRKSKGFKEVSVDDDFRMTGDEPLQIKRKFPDITVIVDSDRCRAMDRLSALPEETRPTLVILDDGFQYRRLRPKTNIVLVNSARPVFEDHLLPFGRLRDLPYRMRKADIVIVTKVHGLPNTQERNEWRRRLKLKENQSIFFSSISFDRPEPIFPQESDPRYIYSKSAVLFTGIADNTPLTRYLVSVYDVKHTLTFADHHSFSHSDLKTIASLAAIYNTSIILTTEKDAQRIGRMSKMPPILKSRMFYIPIRPIIIPEADTYGWNPQDIDYNIGSETLKKELICRLS